MNSVDFETLDSLREELLEYIEDFNVYSKKNREEMIKFLKNVIKELESCKDA